MNKIRTRKRQDAKIKEQASQLHGILNKDTDRDNMNLRLVAIYYNPICVNLYVENVFNVAVND